MCAERKLLCGAEAECRRQSAPRSACYMKNFHEHNMKDTYTDGDKNHGFESQDFTPPIPLQQLGAMAQSGASARSLQRPPRWFDWYGGGIVLQRTWVRLRRVAVGRRWCHSGQRMWPAFGTSVWDQRFGHARCDAIRRASHTGGRRHGISITPGATQIIRVCD